MRSRPPAVALIAAVAAASTTFAQAPPVPPRHFLVMMRVGPAYDVSQPIDEQKGFPAHAAYMNELETKGALVLGGPLLDSFESMKPIGAVLVLRAATADEARQVAAADPSRLLEVQDVRALFLAVSPRR